MDLIRFSSLSNIAKLDYIVIKLEHAKGLISIIYNKLNSISIDELENNNIDLDVISKELENLVDFLVYCGIATEDGRSEEIFEELNIKISRLEEISQLVNKLSFN